LKGIGLTARGNCKFVNKARNVEHAGGALAVIVDNLEEDVETIIPSDDGTGVGINIPTMLIDKAEGDHLIDFILSQKNLEKKQTATL
jgi:hypothetical protein